MALVSEDYGPLMPHKDYASFQHHMGAHMMPASPVQLPPLHASSEQRQSVAAQRVRSPPSPLSPIAANRTTGRVAFGPWGGPFNTSPVAIAEKLEIDNTIYMSTDGRGHLEPPEGVSPRAPASPLAAAEEAADPNELPTLAVDMAEQSEGGMEINLPLEEHLRQVEVPVEGERRMGAAQALPGFAPRSGLRAERRACLAEHQLVSRKGDNPPAVFAKGPAPGAGPQCRQVFQPRRGF